MQLSTIGQKERETQNRVVALFHNELKYRYLGNWEEQYFNSLWNKATTRKYRYLGNWEERENNSNIEEEILTAWLIKKGYSQNLIGKALYEFSKAANDQSKSLYDVNKEDR